MRVSRTRHFARVTVAAVIAAAASSIEAQEQWLLMSRHGECVSISSLKRVFPDMEAVSTPEAFIAFVKRKGLRVTIREFEVPVGQLRGVEVPQKELALWFANRPLCSFSVVKP